MKSCTSWICAARAKLRTQNSKAHAKTLVNGWRTMLDDPLTLERYWMGQAAAGTLVSPEERIEQVADITREQVIAAAQSTALDTVFFMKGAAK